MPMTRLELELAEAKSERDDLSYRCAVAETRVGELEAERDDLVNQISDLGNKARKFTPNDQLRAKLATAEGYRKGIANDLQQVEEQSRGFADELNKIVRIVGTNPARNVLFGPSEGDGVAHVVETRLTELEGKLAHEIEHFRRRSATWSDTRDGLKDRVAELEGTCPGCVQMESRLRRSTAVGRFYEILLLKLAPGALQRFNVSPIKPGEEQLVLDDMMAPIDYGPEIKS